MIYHLLYPLHEYFSVLNVFRYITFRTIYAVVTALIISFLLAKWMITTLRKYQIGEKISQWGPETHKQKAGTPTMGGLLIMAALFIPTLMWADLTNSYVWVLLFATISYAAIGFVDDYIKLTVKGSGGMRARSKFVAQMAVAACVIGVLMAGDESGSFFTTLQIPFMKNIEPDIGLWYLLFGSIVIVGTSNAVNLTDGLDGLATGSLIIASTTFMVLAYLSGNAKFAEYLNIRHVPGAGELTVFCGAAIGAGLGFLWYNSYPAQVFMGNTGSTALGGMLGTLAVLIRQEFLLVLIGGVFVAEALSVIIQVTYFRMTGGKRIFLMAPLHHHFEKKGWAEPKVTVRFLIIALLLALLSLSTLKLR